MSVAVTRGRATALGAVAVALWALLALLTVWSGRVPPFQLTAMCLAVGALCGLGWSAATGRPARAALAQPWHVWALGVGGIFGYHFFYFTALRAAPAAEAGLIAYLWPLLIVLFSGLLPGERLTRLHVLGAVVALGGAALILGPRAQGGFAAEHAAGFAAAGLCALTWSGYSVLSRRVADAPTEAVTGFCAVGAVLSAVCAALLETPVWPAGAAEWLAIAGLGAGPLGLAFYVWDVGVKRGDIQLLGTLSYAAPLLSTLALAAAGEAPATPSLIGAAALIAGGAGLAALGGRPARAPRETPRANPRRDA